LIPQIARDAEKRERGSREKDKKLRKRWHCRRIYLEGTKQTKIIVRRLGMNALAVRVEPRAVEVLFAEDSFRVILADGREVAIPIEWFPRLLKATP
jgi:hypothetical protein